LSGKLALSVANNLAYLLSIVLDGIPGMAGKRQKQLLRFVLLLRRHLSLWLEVDDVIGLRVRDVITPGTAAADNLPGQHSADVSAACRTK